MGNYVPFLLDDWVGVGSLVSLFPRLYGVVSIKLALVKKCYVWVDSSVSWEVSMSRLCFLFWG